MRTRLRRKLPQLTSGRRRRHAPAQAQAPHRPPRPAPRQTPAQARPLAGRTWWIRTTTPKVEDSPTGSHFLAALGPTLLTMQIWRTVWRLVPRQTRGAPGAPRAGQTSWILMTRPEAREATQALPQKTRRRSVGHQRSQITSHQPIKFHQPSQFWRAPRELHWWKPTGFLSKTPVCRRCAWISATCEIGRVGTCYCGIFAAVPVAMLLWSF